MPEYPTKIIRIPDPVVVGDLAAALAEKPFKIMADVMKLGQFQNIHGVVDFETATKIAWKHGYKIKNIGRRIA